MKDAPQHRYLCCMLENETHRLRAMEPEDVDLLFDIENDPHEINNLAHSKKSQHRQALLNMRTALDVWIVETQDRGEFLEPKHIVAPFEKEMHDWFGTPDWYQERN